MPYCPQCGTEVPEGANFCSTCGISISSRMTTQSMIRVSPKPLGDPLGAVGAGIFFILVAFTWINYPALPSDISAYLRSSATQGYPVMITQSLFKPIILFSTAFGIWLIVLFVLRILFKQNYREATANIAGAVFFLLLSYILSQYSHGLIAEKMLLPLFIVDIGILVVFNGLGLLTIHLARKKLNVA